MKYRVNELCIACGLCVGNCPKVFFFNDEGMAEAIDGAVEDADMEAASDAMINCPVGAIEKEE